MNEIQIHVFVETLVKEVDRAVIEEFSQHTLRQLYLPYDRKGYLFLFFE